MQIAALAAQGIEKIDATDDVLSLTIAQYQALGTVALTSADTVSVRDTGANIAALTPAQIAALDNAFIDILDASDNFLLLTVAQYLQLGTTTLSATDTASIFDTGANISSLTAAQISGLHQRHAHFHKGARALAHHRFQLGQLRLGQRLNGG